jgi:hypothetical protein
MLPSTPPPSADARYVWVTTKRWLEWATLAVYVATALWLFALGGHAILIWVLGASYLLLVTSYRRHRIARTDAGIELRTIWWRKLVRWRDVSSVETQPKYRPNTVFVAKQLDPAWHLIISSDGQRFVVASRRSLAEAMREDVERQRAAHSGI